MNYGRSFSSFQADARECVLLISRTSEHEQSWERLLCEHGWTHVYNQNQFIYDDAITNKKNAGSNLSLT